MAIKGKADSVPVSPRRLWFGLLTTAVAWVGLGCIDILINWRACTYQQDYGIPPEQPGPRILIGLLALVLLILAITAGFTSFRNWHQLSKQPLLDAQAVERNQFLAYGGMVVSLTLGVGIFLLGLPPFFLDICWRAR
jgi:hypothetical protein